MDKTIEYYNNNADLFTADTLHLDMHALQDWFLKEVKPGGKIMDLGCGTGRDSAYFLSKGFSVTPVDGSHEMCAIAVQTTGVPVRELLFEDLDYSETFDGIWANASLLHVPSKDMVAVFRRVCLALVPGGVLFVSFKKGDFEGDRGERFYTDMTEEKVRKLISSIQGMTLIDMQETGDTRVGREQERWVNALVKREKEMHPMSSCSLPDGKI